MSAIEVKDIDVDLKDIYVDLKDLVATCQRILDALLLTA